MGFPASEVYGGFAAFKEYLVWALCQKGPCQHTEVIGDTINFLPAGSYVTVKNHNLLNKLDTWNYLHVTSGSCWWVSSKDENTSQELAKKWPVILSAWIVINISRKYGGELQMPYDRCPICPVACSGPLSVLRRGRDKRATGQVKRGIN